MGVMHVKACGSSFRCSPNIRHIAASHEVMRRAMYGRRPRCKRNLTFSEAFGCSHVYGLFSREGACLHRDAADVAAGPDMIR